MLWILVLVLVVLAIAGGVSISGLLWLLLITALIVALVGGVGDLSFLSSTTLPFAWSADSNRSATPCSSLRLEEVSFILVLPGRPKALTRPLGGQRTK